MISSLRCRCGHSIEAHEHFRGGRECSACATDGCRRFSAHRDAPARPTGVLAGVAWSRFLGRSR